MDASFDGLPADVKAAIEPVLTVLPPVDAMQRLAPDGPVSAEASAAVEKAVTAPVLATRPSLQAGLWLYVDELDRSHTISQGIDHPTGSFWHGIMHRREPDFPNSHHWFRKAGDHEAMRLVTQVPASAFGASAHSYDAHAFVDEAKAAVEAGQAGPELIAKQQCEWLALFAWCAAQQED